LIFTLPLLLSVALTGAADTGGPAPFRIQPAHGAASDEIDDPKVARRLKRRVFFPPPAAAPATTVAMPMAVPFARAAAAPPPQESTIVREAAPSAAAPAPERNVPRVKFGYRRFSFVRPGATNPSSPGAGAASQPFNSLSLDFYPLSWFVRMGLSSQYGWESGKFGGGGDYFFAQSFSLGGQYPGRQFTPFVEALGGGGYMRRLQFGRTIPTAYWQMGVDAGVEFFLARYAFVSAAIGYLHPVNGFAQETSFASVYVDTWSFKLGFGL
jgi:hypothetical protein